MNDRIQSSSKQLLSTFCFSILAMLINYALSLCLTPYINNNLGTEAYGFVSLAKTISNYGVIVTSCLNSYISRFVAVKYHEKKYNDAITYYSSAFYANIFFIVVAIILDIVFVWNINSFFVIPKTLYFDVQMLFFIEIISYTLYSLSSVLGAYAYVKNKLSHISIVNIIYYVCEAIILVVLFGCLKDHIYYIAIALLVSAIISLKPHRR